MTKYRKKETNLYTNDEDVNIIEVDDLSDEVLSRSQKSTVKPSRTAWFPTFNIRNLFNKKSEPDEELTFATKHKQGKQKDIKKLITYSLVGLVLISSIGAVAIPLLQSINFSKPQTVEQADKDVQAALSKLKSTQDEPKSVENSSTTTSTTMSSTEDIDAKVKTGVEEATKSVVQEYNKKLDEATKQVQEANSKATDLESKNTKLQSEKEALQKQVDELKSKLNESTTSSTQNTTTNRDTVTLP